MPIRLPVISLLILALAAAPALAMDIEGKWGLGVGASGLIGTSPDLTLIRGRSPASAWLLDVLLSGNNVNGNSTTPTPIDTTLSTPAHDNLNQLFINVAPGVRRFLQPNGDFSPYFDLMAGGFYNHAHQYVDSPGTFTRVEGNVWGLGISCALGAEYLTRWHFSLAAHSGIASVNWMSSHNTYEPSGGGTFDRKTNGVRANFGVSPILAVRVYF
jgi:hypothetical protein